ncbi:MULTISPECIES: DUF742 domain-containing protein [Streptomyces]|uniref:DUF742 domain-containing protein n=1 Tax=Streptomyces TaxID=1883 RepID=UPI000BF1C6D8|nr:DUF742 domain-containing protein [Streptomyces sp. ms184]
MAAPTGGHPYNGDQRVPGEHGDNRFGFPAAPGGQGPGQYQPYQQQEHQQQGAPGGPGPEWPQQQPGPGWPQQPQQRYDSPQQPRIQPVQRRAPEPAKPAAHNPLVRPYAMTGGRTRPRYQLAIEALVSTTADPARLQGQLPEHQRICRLCIEIKSVAEISALLSIPLGVARILVADLAEAGLVAIHQPGGDEAAGGQPDVTLLERVLSGLRKL